MECECQLRPWRLSDAADLATAIGSKKVQDNLRDGIPFPYTEDDARAFIREMLDADPDAVYAYAITVEDRAIGSIGVYRQGNIHRRTAELGYYLAEPFWGKGLATSAVSAVCTASLTVPISCGFTRSRLLTTPPPAACWRNAALSVRARCGATLRRTAGFWI